MKLVTHLRRERRQDLVRFKKANAVSLACEVCGFDSFKKYGIDYCEVHHLTPLSELETESETTLEDLAIVCANCHRVIHSENPPIQLLALKKIIEGFKLR